MIALRASLLLGTAVGLTTAFTPFLASAEDSADAAFPLGEITVTASSQPVAVSRTGASVTVLTEKDIAQSAPLSLAEKLSQEPGVSLSRTGGAGAQTTLRLRGLGGAYIGTRFDGIDITDPSLTQTAFNFGTMTPAALSRVEILRGSQSALYGANAVGGVIDITSWRPTEDGQSGAISVLGGSDSTWSGTASAGIKGDRGEFAISASRSITDGISSAASGSERDSFQTSLVTAYGRYALTENLSLGANGFWSRSRGGMDGTSYDYATGESTVVDTDDTQDVTLRGGRIFADLTTGAVTHRLSFARSETKRSYYYPDYASTYVYKGTRNVLTYEGRWQARPDLSLDWGASRSREASEGNGHATTNSVYGEALLTPMQGLDISLALRNDVHSTYGAKPTGRAAVAWHVAEDWILRSSYSTGYRTPSLYELYSDYGNRDFNPEKSRSFEIGAEHLFEGGSVQATLFRTRIKDRILWSDSAMTCASAAAWGYPGCYDQIDGDTKTSGLELTAHYALTPDWTVSGNYTYTDAKQDDAGTKSRADRVPRHVLNLGLEGRVADRWHLGGNVQYVADVLDDGTGLPDYTLVNASIAYDINEKTQAFLQLDNLFDKDYETVRGYGEPGRQVFVGLRAAF